MLRVLLVDDEFVITFLLRTDLESAGCEVLGTVTNGKAAVEFCRAHRPDVVLMDVRMPVMDGIEATRLIMAENPTCIMIMTAYGDADTAERAEAVGAMGYLTKPVSPETVLAAAETARTHFQEFLKIRAEIPDLDDALAVRRLVEAAKRAIVGCDGASPGGEFAVLQRLAAKREITLREAAETVVAEATQGRCVRMD